MKEASALSGIVAGAAIAITGGTEGFVGETAPTSFILGLTPALATPLLVALHRRQEGKAGRFGEAAFVLNLIGLGLFGGAAFTLNMALYYVTTPLPAVTRLALLGSAVIFAVGSVLFGAAMLRARVTPRVPTWGYTTLLP